MYNQQQQKNNENEIVQFLFCGACEKYEYTNLLRIIAIARKLFFFVCLFVAHNADCSWILFISEYKEITQQGSKLIKISPPLGYIV